MKLAEPLKLKSLQAPGCYSLALRAIGQDLAKLSPGDLAIEAQPDGFTVRGHCPEARLEGESLKNQKPALTDSLSQLFRRAAAPVPPDPRAEVVEFTRVYSSHDFDRLDQHGAIYRSGLIRIPDPRSLGETLRTIGRMIDENNCRLTSIKKSADRLIVEYRDTDDQPQSEEFTNTALYKLQRRYYDNRGTFKIIDLWKGKHH